MIEKTNRKVVLHNFYGEGRDIYEDELGWRADSKREAGSVVSRDIFRFEDAKKGGGAAQPCLTPGEA